MGERTNACGKVRRKDKDEYLNADWKIMLKRIVRK
jgi:hypothetical protein